METVRGLTPVGWTLHEMLISLSVMAGVAALAAHAAVGQLRFVRGVGDVIAARSQTTHAAQIVAASVWAVSPVDGDLVVASDSAIEVRASLGAAVVCGGYAGTVTVPLPREHENTFAAFVDVPSAGDLARVYVADSLGERWVPTALIAAPTSGGPCESLPNVDRTWSFALRDFTDASNAVALQVLRPIRLSLYRASDGRWYLGARDWNGDAQRLNTIQPVAGPLTAYREAPDASGFHLSFLDASGMELPRPVDAARVASVAIRARSETRRPVRVSGIRRYDSTLVDSVLAVVALRNVR